MNIGIELNTSVFKEILEWRKSRFVTNKMIAEWIGVTEDTFYNWRSGKNYPSVKHFKGLVMTLRLTRNEVRYLVPNCFAVMKKRGLMPFYRSLYYVKPNTFHGVMLGIMLRDQVRKSEKKKTIE